jgi:hypothetical protein
MTKQQFDTYKFSKNTLVLFRGYWSDITEVWFREGKIGIEVTGHLADYSEIEDIKEKL